jgi:hypothetical protein
MNKNAWERDDGANKTRRVGPWNYYTGTAAAPPRWLIKNILPETGVALIAGQWGTYKTTVALDIALAVMRCPLFAGRYRVKRSGAVLYVALEGQGMLMARLNALAAYRDVDGPLPFAWRGDCPALSNTASATATLCALTDEATTYLHAEFGVPVVLIVIDTMITAAQYGDGAEDDAGATQKVLRTLRLVAEHSRALVVGIDHFGKVIETGTRGSSVKETNSDTVLALLADRELSGGVRNTRVAVRKQRDGIAGAELPFNARSIEIGTDEDGDAITAPVIDWQDSGTISAALKTKDGWSNKTLRLLQRTLINVLVDHGQKCQPFSDMPEVRAVDTDIVRNEFYRSMAADGDAEQKQATRRQAFHRAITDAQDRRLIGVREVDGKTLLWLVQTPANQ